MDNEEKKNAEPTEEQLVTIRSNNFVILLHYLEKQGIDPALYLHLSRATIERIVAGKQKAPFFALYRMQKGFSKISYRKVRSGKEELPANEDYGFEQKTAKLRYLDAFLKEKEKGLTLARAMSLSLRKWKNLESGYALPSQALLRKIAVYFFLPAKMLMDDEEQLPPYEKLKIDEDLAVIQRNDLEEQMNYVKNRHYLSRNYRVLSHAMRVKMILSLLLALAPLAAFTGYSAYDIIQGRNEDLSKFALQDIRDNKSKKFAEGYIASHSKDKTNSQAYTYCDVNIGIQVIKVFDIKPANEYFSAALKVWFDFSQDEFHTMFMNYKSDAVGDADFAKADASVTPYGKDMDLFTVGREDNAVSYGSDAIPDYIELATPYDLAKVVLEKINPSMNSSEQQEAARLVINANPALTKLRNNWTDERKSYPGLTTGTMYKDYSPNFNIGKGIDADSLRYLYAPGEAYCLYNGNSVSASGSREYRFFQCCTFTAKVGKAYDNPRYPLETAQFWMNIEPADWLNVNNIRYVQAPTIDVSRNQLSKTTAYDHCSIDELVYRSMDSSIAFTDGFRSIKNFDPYEEAIEYNVDPTYVLDESKNLAFAGESHSKYTVVVRANRAAFTKDNFLPSTFLQTYINLAAVIIWIIIAFYNQSYAGEDSLGMLGTGMFSAISATIVGFQMLSDASMFSLLTMINIFTLVVILVMTYQSVAAKRANAKKDKALIAYNGVKLRIMFYILTICTLIMFIGLPIAAYIWTV